MENYYTNDEYDKIAEWENAMEMLDNMDVPHEMNLVARIIYAIENHKGGANG